MPIGDGTVTFSYPTSNGMASFMGQRGFLDDAQVWAVVGLSGDPARTAYAIADLLHSRGKRVVPIHPNAPELFGEQGYATLAEVPFEIDVVDVFRRSESARCDGG